MKRNAWLVAALLAAGVASLTSAPASAKTLKWAAQNDLLTFELPPDREFVVKADGTARAVKTGPAGGQRAAGQRAGDRQDRIAQVLQAAGLQPPRAQHPRYRHQ